jgi:hypothetical protein
MNKKYYLFLDDQRSVLDVRWAVLPNKGQGLNWISVKNYEEFIDCIGKNGLPEFVSFDHDLAPSHYKAIRTKNYNYIEKTGYDCAKWLMNYCQIKSIKFPNYAIHSMNPSGAQNIKQLLERFKKYQDEQNNLS